MLQVVLIRENGITNLTYNKDTTYKDYQLSTSHSNKYLRKWKFEFLISIKKSVRKFKVRCYLEHFREKFLNEFGKKYSVE